MQLDWPVENADDPTLPGNRWFHPSSNCCLDFHGDPVASELRVFSDGNHHMALEETLKSFRSKHELSSVFYCTTPPKVYLDWMRSGTIEIGNLRLDMSPNIVIGPDDILQKLASRDMLSATSRCSRKAAATASWSTRATRKASRMWKTCCVRMSGCSSQTP